MFPDAWPGIGLLLLRSSVTTSLLVEAFSRAHSLPEWIRTLAAVPAAALGAGYMTPIAAALGLLCHALIWSRAEVHLATSIVVSLDMLAVALLGPGAFSVDAYRYGRRILLLPPR